MKVWRIRLVKAVLLVSLGISFGLAQAGRPCEVQKSDPFKINLAFEFAMKTQRQLDASGADLVLIARVGQDLSKYRLRYSHLAFAQKQGDGRWLVSHQLNRCGTAESGIYREGLANFFLDDMYALESLILVPGKSTQLNLAKQLERAQILQFYEPHYNMLAYPFATRYQNSNQWVLETYAASYQGNLASRTQVQSWLQASGYQPEVLQLSAMTRLGARVFKANIAFDDQVFEQRMSGKISTVSVESVWRFLQKNEPELRHYVVQN